MNSNPASAQQWYNEVEEAAQALKSLTSPKLFTERYLAPETQYLEWYSKIDKHLAENDDVLFLVHPGCGKSTRLSFIETLMAICKDRTIRIGFFSKTEQKAKLFMLNVARELRTNRKLIRDFGIFFDPRDKDCYYSQSMIRVTGATGKEKEPTIINFGASSQYESLRLDLIILDDAVDLKSSRSPTEVAWMDKTLGSLEDRLLEETPTRTAGKFIILGHRFLPHDFYSVIMNSRPHIKPLVLPAVDDNGNPLAHPIWTRAGIEKRKSKKKAWEWQAYYMQNPVPPEDSVFKDVPLVMVKGHVDLKGISSAMDPAYTQPVSMTDDPDWSVAMAGMPYKKGMLITDIEDWRINRGWASAFCNFAVRALARIANVEINNAQTLGTEMDEYRKRHELPLLVRPFKSKDKKENRIGNFADWARENTVYVLQSVTTKPAFIRFKEQWDNYPNTSHEDHLDCADMLRNNLKKSRGGGAARARI